ncbi:amino acid transporter AVT1E-like [Aristolochia californica]|uniref:amino acid transporter AVT1E-like n=1 Tax=Aristolochia californica TaxID=171875 RepID=UPI0035D93E6B
MTLVDEGVFLMNDEEHQSQKELLLDDNNLKDDDERGEDASQYQKINSWPQTFGFFLLYFNLSNCNASSSTRGTYHSLLSPLISQLKINEDRMASGELLKSVPMLFSSSQLYGSRRMFPQLNMQTIHHLQLRNDFSEAKDLAPSCFGFPVLRFLGLGNYLSIYCRAGHERRYILGAVDRLKKHYEIWDFDICGGFVPSPILWPGSLISVAVFHESSINVTALVNSMENYGSVPHSSVVLEAGSRSLSRSLTRLNNSFLSLSPTKRATSYHLESTLTASLLHPDKETADKPSLAPRSASWLSFTSSAAQLSFHEPIKGSPKCSYAQSVFNGINVMCGVGLLSTPYAIKQGGWLGLLILFAFSLIACYTGVLLKRCLESNPALHTFPDIAQAAFGTPGRLVISILLYAELYAACVEFIILMGDNLSSVFPDVHVNLVGVFLNSHQLFSILATVAVLPTAWLRNLSFMSYLSAGGVIASVLVVLCLLWVGVIDGVGFHPSGTALDIANLPVALGLYGFCYAGHPLFPNIYLSMQNPADFPSVLLLSFIICTVLYSGVAITGFLMFGGAIESQFTLNMPTTFVASKIAVWTTVVNPLTKYALTITPVALSLEELLPLAWFKSHLVSILIRTTLVLSTLLVAITFPFFGFIMALIGSFITMIIALIFPCASYLKLMRGKLSRIQVLPISLFCVTTDAPLLMLKLSIFLNRLLYVVRL